MSDSVKAVLSAIEATGSIPKDQVLAWMADADLETRGALYVLTDKAWSRIQPPLTMGEQCSFMAAYLLDCLETNPQSGNWTHSGFEAAWELASWLKHLDDTSGTVHVLQNVAQEIERIYRRADRETKDRIMAGLLDHAFEQKTVRRFFAHWQRDPVLRRAYELCAEWGDAHAL